MWRELLPCPGSPWSCLPEHCMPYGRHLLMCGSMVFFPGQCVVDAAWSGIRDVHYRPQPGDKAEAGQTRLPRGEVLRIRLLVGDPGSQPRSLHPSGSKSDHLRTQICKRHGVNPYRRVQSSRRFSSAR